MSRRPVAAPGPRLAKMPRLGPDPRMAKALRKVGSTFALWRPAPQVLLNVEAVPTLFPGVNRVSRVGGWPIARVAVAHGPSNEGKTAFALGLEGSFLARGHLVGHIDAENTTPMSWVEQLLREYAASPGFYALRPQTYEEARDAVLEFANGIDAGRKAGDLDEATTGLVVVDSIRKLTPKALMKELLKAIADDAAEEEDGRRGRKKPKGMDGAGGRAGQIKAAINAVWLDELVPLLARTRTAALIIARETEVEGDGFFATPQVKIGGGGALKYDSSLVVRITRDQFLYESKEKGAALVGERHAVEVHKTKVAGRDERWPTGYFSTSNGKLAPAGFDHARDVFELGTEVGAIETASSWFSFEGKRLGNGVNAAIQALREDPGLAARVVEAVAEVDKANGPMPYVPSDAPLEATG